MVFASTGGAKERSRYNSGLTAQELADARSGQQSQIGGVSFSCSSKARREEAVLKKKKLCFPKFGSEFEWRLEFKHKRGGGGLGKLAVLIYCVLLFVFCRSSWVGLVAKWFSSGKSVLGKRNLVCV